MLPTAPRLVNFSTFWSLLRERGPFGTLGLAFVLGPLFLLLPMLLVMQSALRQPYEKYDYDTIGHDGTATTARITSVAAVHNVTVNGQHPQLLTYTYTAVGQPRTDRFQTFDTERVSTLHVGDQVGIKVLRGESIIPSLTPFRFPFGYFYILPGVFLLIGVPFLLIGLLPALRKYRLYRYGRPQEGTVQGITSRPVRMSQFNAMQSFVVSYEYAGLHQRHLGEDRTNDWLLVNEKRSGDKITILVSEQDEAYSCLWPRLAALKNGWQL